MIYIKTPEGRAALQERYALTLRERQLMVLCNGVRSFNELLDLFGDSVAEDIKTLVDKKFLSPESAASKPVTQVAEQWAAGNEGLPTPAFMASRLPEEKGVPALSELKAKPRMTLEELTALADVPPVKRADFEDSTANDSDKKQDNRDGEELTRAKQVTQVVAAGSIARTINSIDTMGAKRSALAAQAYMSQVLMALDTERAVNLVESHGDVRHEVDIMVYLAQGLGLVHEVVGEDAALRVAMRTGGLLPETEVPMLVDGAIDYVPASFSLLLYEFVLAGKENT